MISLKMEREIEALVKLGLNEKKAKFIVLKKHKIFEEIAEELLQQIKEEEKDLEENLSNFTLYESTIENK